MDLLHKVVAPAIRMSLKLHQVMSLFIIIFLILIFIFFCCICFLMEIKENLEAVQIKNEREVEYLLPYSEKLP